jgi:hypothetical protein
LCVPTTSAAVRGGGIFTHVGTVYVNGGSVDAYAEHTHSAYSSGVGVNIGDRGGAIFSSFSAKVLGGATIQGHARTNGTGDYARGGAIYSQAASAAGGTDLITLGKAGAGGATVSGTATAPNG